MPPLLSVTDLRTHFPTKGGAVRAVDGVSFTVAQGETLGLVGESGCGKTTLGRTVLRLIPPTSGSIRLDGDEIGQLSRRALRPYRRRMQMIFQDPFASLNPRLSVGRIVAEPMLVNGIGDARARRDRVVALLERVGLRAEALTRHPHEFSGGQRQRIGIARALTLDPALLICDEPVSALDVSVRAQVVNLLLDIQAERGLSYIFISHDLSLVRQICARVAVMYLGRIVELAEIGSLWRRPLHPYSQALLSAVPVPDPVLARTRRRILLGGDLPSPADPPSGCRFHTRCRFATDLCRQVEPELRALAPGHEVACHLVTSDGAGEPIPPSETDGDG